MEDKMQRTGILKEHNNNNNNNTIKIVPEFTELCGLIICRLDFLLLSAKRKQRNSIQLRDGSVNCEDL